MATTNEDISPYERLGVKSDATEQEIKTAYRQRSLKVHPDRNRNNPDAARLFHELNQAYELLLDPLRKLALDAQLRLKHARAERFASYDAKRKSLVAELEEREEAFKKARMDKRREEAERWKEEERIKEEGRRMREEREKAWLKRGGDEQARNVEEEAEEMPPSIGPLNTTVRLKYTLLARPTLTTPAALSALLASFGPTDESTIQISLKPSKRTPEGPPKFATAVVEFKLLADAFAAVCASGKGERGLEGVKIDWAEGKEPDILGWLRRNGKLGNGERKSDLESPNGGVTDGVKGELPQVRKQADTSSYSSFPETFPDVLPALKNPPGDALSSVIDYESLTLMRLRQAEREKLEKEVLEREARGE